MLYICLSFDYELYMGKNFLPLKEVLINPTYKLLDLMDENNVKGTFFADVCCPMTFSKNNCQSNFVINMEEQLRNMISRRHDVQLHIHPHWYKTMYNQSTGDVTFDKKYYRIHSYGFGKNGEINADKIVSDSINYLNNLFHTVNTDYKCIAFRAGGFAIQPENNLVKILSDNGIKIDSSVAPGMKYLGKNMRYDYSNLGQFKFNYFFNETEGLSNPSNKKISESDLFEVPIGTYRPGILNKLVDKITSKCSILTVSRGAYMDLSGEAKSFTKQQNNNVLKKIINKVHSINKTYMVLSIDSYDGNMLYKYIKKLYNKKNCKENDVYISLIGHPKGFGQQQYLCLKQLIEKVKKTKYMEFVTFRDIYEQLEL